MSVAYHDPDFDPAKVSHQMALTLSFLFLFSRKERKVDKRNGKE